MKKINFFVLLSLISLIIIPDAFAKQGHLKLLAVSEISNGTFRGGTADLYLEIKDGSGRVFLETFPLTKTDTQMSTRLAKAIACDFAEKDCSTYDFFYTITADSAFIAGPSAGSSIAGLTVAMLLDKEVNEDYAATGTINSGGLVGPVGGVKEKIEAAAKSGIKKVLIPAGEVIGSDENETINATEFSKKLGIKIVEVSTVDDIVYELTGYKKKKENINIDVDKEYSSKMKVLSVQLCDRSKELNKGIEKINFTFNASLALEEIKNLTAAGKEAFDKNLFYSSASYCFGANAGLTTIIMQSKNLSKNEIATQASELKEKISEFNKKIDSKQIRTIADLETFMMVKERLEEADEIADKSASTLNISNSTIPSVKSLAYAVERFNSAFSWAEFFGTNGRQFNLNKAVLKKSCQTRISEVEERVQYVELYIPNSQENVQKGLEDAYSDLSNGKFELCLFKATKAKAEVDVVLSVFGAGIENFKNILERKLTIVRENLAAQSKKGIFSIVGYSYYEYANSLKNSNTLSGLVYSEYALELGNLDIYLKEDMPLQTGKKSKESKIKVDNNYLIIFLSGIGIGFITALLITTMRKKFHL